jgi:hypothetical protein
MPQGDRHGYESSDLTARVVCAVARVTSVVAETMDGPGPVGLAKQVCRRAALSRRLASEVRAESMA